MSAEPELPRLKFWTGEEELLATLLCVIDQACATKGDELDSYALSAYARAMRCLASCGLFEIQDEFGRRVFGRITPQGQAYIARLYEEEDKDALRQQRHATEQFRARAIEAFICRRAHALLSDEWRRRVREARELIRLCRSSKRREADYEKRLAATGGCRRPLRE